MRAFVTGATGFLGGVLARKLRERGDEVVALVRSPSRASGLQELRCEMVPGDLGDEAALSAGTAGADAVFHVAAMYKVGVPASMREEMIEANVRGTERVMDAAASAGVKRIVYVSTVGAFGNTHGKVVDEMFVRRPGDWLSLYDETKYLAHEVVKERIAAGAPAIIVMPGGIYGPGDQSDLANFLEQLRKGRLKMFVFPDTGFNFVHVEDAADGILLAHDRGRVGETYVLGGQLTSVREAIVTAATLYGRKPPRFTLPPVVAKASIPVWPLVARFAGMGPNLRELIRAADGVTYWATDEKARRELGYAPRELATGLRQTIEAERGATAGG